MVPRRAFHVRNTLFPIPYTGNIIIKYNIIQGGPISPYNTKMKAQNGGPHRTTWASFFIYSCIKNYNYARTRENAKHLANIYLLSDARTLSFSATCRFQNMSHSFYNSSIFC